MLILFWRIFLFGRHASGSSHLNYHFHQLLAGEVHPNPGFVIFVEQGFRWINWLLIQDEFQFRRCDEAAAILKNPGTISQCWCEKGKPCQKLEKPVWVPGRFPSQTLSVNECKTPHFLKCKTSPLLETYVKTIKIHFNPHLDHHLNKLLKVHRTWPIPICVLFYNFRIVQVTPGDKKYKIISPQPYRPTLPLSS